MRGCQGIHLSGRAGKLSNFLMQRTRKLVTVVLSIWTVCIRCAPLVTGWGPLFWRLLTSTGCRDAISGHPWCGVSRMNAHEHGTAPFGSVRIASSQPSSSNSIVVAVQRATVKLAACHGSALFAAPAAHGTTLHLSTTTTTTIDQPCPVGPPASLPRCPARLLD
jgi:hypothetical protein